MARGWRSLLRSSVVVNLTSGRAFEGVLMSISGPLLVLRDARIVESGRAPIPVDGEVIVDGEMVEFVQVVARR